MFSKYADTVFMHYLIFLSGISLPPKETFCSMSKFLKGTVDVFCKKEKENPPSIQCQQNVSEFQNPVGRNLSGQFQY